MPKKKAEAPTKKKVAKAKTKAKTSTKKKSTKKKASKTKAKASSKKKSKKKSGLAAARDFLNKTLKTTDWKADLDTKQLSKSIPHHPSGSLILDQLIGGKVNEHGVAPCPGYPVGKIINIYGHEGAGKTTVALTAAAKVIENGGDVVYIDWENEIVPGYAKSLGIPIGDEEKFLLAQPETLEQGCSIAWVAAGHEVDLVIFDSVGAGVPKALMEKSVSEVADGGRLGANAAIWSKFLPKLKHRINKSGTTIIAISQLRSAVNVMGYGEQFTVQGGKAWRFFSALRMHFKSIGKDKANVYDPLTNKTVERVVGVKTRARLEKCKVSPQQGNEEVFYIRWGKGIDDLRSLIEIGKAHGLVRQKGAWYYWTDPDGEEHSGQGLPRFYKFFVDNERARKALERQVKPFMAGKSDDPLVDGGDDDEDLFTAEGFDNDDDLQNMLESIALEDPPDLTS